MVKDNTSVGLLSKMVKFVRNTATSWTELDNKVTDRDEVASKLLLKEMIERKRRNDFVRKRELDMLRKTRKREAIVGQDPGGRPSFFHSSLPSKPDDRAKTIKKIDEIEAQMSMQWWKTKHGMASTLQSVDSSGSQMDVNVSPLVQLPINTCREVAFPDLLAVQQATGPIGLQPLKPSNALSPVTNRF